MTSSKAITAVQAIVLEDMFLQLFLKKMSDISLQCNELFRHSYWPWQDGPLLPNNRAASLRSSKPLLYAALSYASFGVADRPTAETFEYLGRCYKHLIEAISAGAILEVIYTSYTILVLGFKMKESWDIILTHLSGVFQALKNLDLAQVKVQDRELMWMERLWQNILHKVWFRLKSLGIHDSSMFARSMETICGILESGPSSQSQAVSQFPNDYFDEPVALLHEAHTLGIYMHFYSSHYIVHCSNQILDYESKSLTLDLVLDGVMEILGKIKFVRLREELQLLFQFDFNAFINLINNDNEPPTLRLRYRVVLSLYFFVIIMKGWLLDDYGCEEVSYSSFVAAMSLCQIALAQYPMHVEDICPFRFEIRNLFLAALVLGKSRYRNSKYQPDLYLICTVHKWIKGRLVELLDCAIRARTLEPHLKVLPTFLEQAERCTSTRELWAMKVEQVCLWQCLLDLPPWVDVGVRR